MATKTLSITEEAYNRLNSRKKEGESFTDVIKRLTKRESLTKFAGILPEREANELEKNIRKSRTDSRKRTQKIKGMLS